MSRFSVRRFGSFARVALAASAVIVIGCQDSIAPKEAKTPEAPPVQPVEVNPAFAALADALRDASDVFIENIADDDLRIAFQTSIGAIGGHLRAGKIADAKTAILRSRELLATLDNVLAVELAPVELALDFVDGALAELGE